jgi:hypothetical protein
VPVFVVEYFTLFSSSVLNDCYFRRGDYPHCFVSGPEMSSDLGGEGGFRGRIHSGTAHFEKQNEDFF